MKLPKLSFLISLFLIISLLVPQSLVFAQNTAAGPSIKKPVAEESVRGTQKTKSDSPASDEEGEVKVVSLVLWAAAGLVAAYVAKEYGKEIKEGIDCVKDFHQCVEGTLIITENYAYKSGTGCNFTVPIRTPDSSIQFPADDDGDCVRKKINAYLNGATLAETPSPGVLDFTNEIAVRSFTLPVPIKSSQYFASINPFKETHAQGFTSELSDSSILLNIWKSIRNVSYTFLVVLLVIIGFMVMVRWKLDPRTSVTVQTALPRIVVAMILITFSYAIAGLMVDIVRVITELLLRILPGNLTFNMSAIVFLVLGSFGSLGATAPIFISGNWIFMIALLAIALIVLILVFIVFIYLIFKILVRFATFIVLTILAPFFFLAGALPGGDVIIISWFKRQTAALIAIPAIAFMVKMSFLIGFSAFTAPSSVGSPAFQMLPIPWFLGRPLDSLLGWMAVGPLLGLGLFFFATKIPDIVDELFSIRPLAPKGGIGPGAILGAPIAALTMGGNVSRAATGVGALATSYAQTGGITGGLARIALGIPGIGTPENRTVAGVASPEERVEFRRRQADVRKRTGQPEPDHVETEEFGGT